MLVVNIHIRNDMKDRIVRCNLFEFAQRCVFIYGHMRTSARRTLEVRLQNWGPLLWWNFLKLNRVTLTAARPKHTELHSHLAYGLLTIVPPAPDARVENVPRDLVVLLDTSGSMSGAPLAQAKKVVGLLVDSLGPDDSIELVEFSYQPRRWRERPVPATKTEKQAASKAKKKSK